VSTAITCNTVAPQVALKKAFRFPASFAQRRLWFLDQLEPGDASYNLTGAVRIEGPVHLDALKKALKEIVRRHESLRTCFASVRGEPCQVIEENVQVPLPVVDLRGKFRSTSPSDQDTEIRRLAREDSQKPFDLKRGPLLRLKLLRLADDQHVFLLTMHHIISDAWSLGVLMHEFSVLYSAFSVGRPSPLPELFIQYVDFTAWQQKCLNGPVLNQQLEYWKKQLADVPALELPTDRPRAALAGHAGRTLYWHLSTGLTRQLKELSQREGVTVFMTLLAAFKLLLSRYSGQNDIAVGTPIAGRRLTETEALIGFFVNTLVVRSSLGGTPSFRELLARVRGTALAAYSHQDLPFEKLIEELQPDRDVGRVPLVQVMFVFQNAPWPELQLGGSKLRKLDVENGTANFELTLVAGEVEGVFHGGLNFHTALFNESSMRRFLEHWDNLLTSIAAAPERLADELSLMNEAERQQVVLQWNQTTSEYPQQSLHQLFDAQASRTPDEAAVVWCGGRLSYAELQKRVWQMARFLSSFGIGPEARVGICLDTGEELIAAILGTIAVGAAYVPLDPDYPGERLAWIIAETRPEIVITSQSLGGKIPGSTTRLMYVGDEWERISQPDAGPWQREVDAANLLYIIYTSGSTGRAKGVAISQASLISRIHFLSRVYHCRPGDRCLQILSPSFDAFGGGMYSALLSGGAVVFSRPEEVLDAAGLVSAIQRERITQLRIPVGFLRQVLLHLVENGDAFPESLRLIVTGGETISRPEMRDWLKRCAPGARFLHEYGPTETTITATLFEDDRDSHAVSNLHRFAIGKPHANTQAYVLNESMEPDGIGVAGELYIGGVALARGYFGNTAMTAEKFVPHPFSSEGGERLYRTGDWARWMEDGNLEFLGRRDEQVKVRGYRVELGEIEAALRQHPGVKEAAAALQDDANGGKCLIGYIVPSAQPASAAELRTFIQGRLPDYMVPSAFLELSELPLMPGGGKLDRKKLPSPPVDLSTRPAGTPPRTPVEEILCGIFAELLKRERVVIEDNFFDLGGHSLLATQAIARVRQAFGVELALRVLFEFPVVAGLARRIELEKHKGEGLQVPPILKAGRTGALPLSFAQQRLWWLCQLQPLSAAYNMPSALRVRGVLDVEVLQQSLSELLRRHEVLRTRFEAAHGDATQSISDAVPLDLPVIDLSALAPEQREPEALRLAQEEAVRPFDLEHGPVFRAQVMQLDIDDHVLLVTMHHIASDGWSVNIMVSELAAIYRAYSSRQPSPLPELKVQYADYALWQREWLQGEVLDKQLAYWRKQLAGLPALELPTDYPQPPVRKETGSVLTWKMPLQLTHQITELSRNHRSTLFMVLLSAFQALLSRYSRQDEIVVGTPIAGRRWAEIEGLIGCFVNTLVLRADLGGAPGFAEFLQRVKQATLDAYSHQDVPFEKLVEALAPARDLSRTPLFQAMFMLQNPPQSQLELGDARLTPLNVNTATVKFDLTLAVAETDTGFQAAIEYSTDLFARETIERLAAHYENLLRAIAATPGQAITDLPMLSDSERRQIIAEWNTTDAPYERGACLAEMVEKQAAQTPNAIAVRDAEEELTYAQLVRQMTQLARYLRELEAGPEIRIALCLKRSARMVTALLGILKSGAAYIPLDPDYPVERLRYMLQDAEASILLTEESLLGQLPSHRGATVLLDRQWAEIMERSANVLPQAALPENLAYVIYTSGSTGLPKGVAICHGSAVTLLHWAQAVFSRQELAGVLAATSICFDLSVFEIFVPLSQGGGVLMADNALQLAAMKDSNRVTLINTVPSAMRELLRMEAVPQSVLAVNLAGEALAPVLVREIYAATTASRVFNLYGPTEDTTYSTYALLGRDERSPASPIGRPISNTQAYVLDGQMEPVPIGVAGELYLGGEGLARGYLNRPELTAERFVPDRFGVTPGSRLYRTGDLVRYLRDGRMEFLGRLDHQVKIRGFRIELGEIESTLSQQPGVQAAVALAHEEKPGERRLVAYVAAGKNNAISEADLRHGLRQKLPEYMVPAQFMVLDQLPLTPNGKVDRKRLPSPERRAAGEESYVAPNSHIEHTLAAIWAEVLAVDKVGMEDNFFDLGGHSLLVPRVRAAVQQKLQRDLPMVEFFTYPTIHALARRMEENAEKAIDIVESQGRAGRQREHLLRRRQAAAKQLEQREMVQ
jgi:amino acid adenylation domain-containing protein